MLYALVTAPLIVVALVAGLLFLRQVPRTGHFLRNRVNSQEVWSNGYAGELSRVVPGVLDAVCDAFLLERADKWRLLPSDTLGDIYRAHYPPELKLPDTLEYGFLFEAFVRDFKVPADDLLTLWRPELTIDALVRTCARHAGKLPFDPNRQNASDGPLGERRGRPS